MYEEETLNISGEQLYYFVEYIRQTFLYKVVSRLIKRNQNMFFQKVLRDFCFTDIDS